MRTSSATLHATAHPVDDLARLLVAPADPILLEAGLGVGTTIVAVNVARARLRVVPRAREVISLTELVEVEHPAQRVTRTAPCRTCVRTPNRTAASTLATCHMMSSGII